MIRGLHAVLTAVWHSGIIPPDWKRGLVVPILKGKGDRQDCSNYRGITLLSVPGKLLAHLLLTQIRTHLLKHQRPEQSGFKPGKSTTDRILVLYILVEHRREFQQGMLADYVDLKKAFDSVHRKTLWDLLHLRGILARIFGLLTVLCSGTVSAVKYGGVEELLPCEFRCEAGLCACSITFQHMHGLSTRQSCGTKSLWSMSATPRLQILFLLMMQQSSLSHWRFW